MRRSVLLSLALTVLASPALALVEPHTAGTQARVEPGARDSRVRSVVFEPGQVIRIVGSPGRTLMIGLPRGMEVFTFLSSDQDVIEAREPDTAPSGQGTGRPPQAQQPGDCSLTKTLQVCVKRERFIAVMPLVPLSPQPLHVIALRARPNAEPEEVTFLFELETEAEEGAARTASAGGPMPMPGGYYLVNVTMGAPAATPPRAAPPPVAGRPAPPRRPVTVRRPPAPAAPDPEPPPVNTNYGVRGDRSLVGEPR